MGFACILALCFASIVSAQSVRLTAYPQKFVSLHSLDDSRARAALSRSSGTRVTASDGAVWEAAPRGLTRLDKTAEQRDRLQYFAGRRYLPDDRVEQIAADDSRGVWVRTQTGISHIELRPLTLKQKADYFEQRVRRRHDRYGLVANSRLMDPENLESNRTQPSDNDGLWTAMYAAAECFRYAVTKSPEALNAARKSIEAVLFLEQVTGVPGLPARSFVKKGDPPPGDGTWHWTPDGEYRWKADTSSDEIVGHFFIFGMAWDLLPRTDPLRDRIRATARRITDHIIDHGWLLVDVHGEPTYWGRWSPDYFRTRRGRPDAPLNAIELLSFLATTRHITGEAKYDAAYRKVAWEMGYAETGTRLLESRRVINYSDEELAMLSFYLLFEYEKEPKLLDLYRKAADQWWQNIERERNPLWTFIYLRGRPQAAVDLPGAAWTLYRIPMDLRDWAVSNSHRSDVVMEPASDRFGRLQAKTLLPPDERPVMKWNGNPFRIDGGGNGSNEDDGAFFLLPYWMGRHYRYLLGD